jgi:hypothetical protein
MPTPSLPARLATSHRGMCSGMATAAVVRASLGGSTMSPGGLPCRLCAMTSSVIASPFAPGTADPPPHQAIPGDKIVRMTMGMSVCSARRRRPTRRAIPAGKPGRVDIQRIQRLSRVFRDISQLCHIGRRVVKCGLRRVSTAVVQRFCKPKVGGSSPSPGTNKFVTSPDGGNSGPRRRSIGQNGNCRDRSRRHRPEPSTRRRWRTDARA